jgi:transcription elongation factor Elf1
MKSIHLSDVPAPEMRTVAQYKGKFYWHDTDLAARKSFANVYTCPECHEENISIGSYRCHSCQEKLEAERYNSFPEDDLKSFPVYSRFADKFFYSAEEIDEYIEDCNYIKITTLGGGGMITLDTLKLVHCKEEFLRQVDEDYWGGEFPEDGTIEDYPAIAEALDNLNTLIRLHPAISYFPTEVRVRFGENLQQVSEEIIEKAEIEAKETHSFLLRTAISGPVVGDLVENGGI